MKIQDGAGGHKWLEIDSNNRAQVRAQSELVIAVKSLDDGDAYQMFLDPMSLTPGLKNVLYFKNTSETRAFVLNKYFIGFNGGDTNHDRCAIIKQYINNGTPTANATQTGAGNLRTSSGNQASLLVYQSSAGVSMTQTAGIQAGAIIAGKGTDTFDIQGSTVIGAGDSITIAVDVEETGLFSVTIEGYFS